MASPDGHALPEQVDPPTVSVGVAALDLAVAPAVAVAFRSDDHSVVGSGQQVCAHLGLDVPGLLAHHDLTGGTGQVIRHVTGDQRFPVLFLVALGAEPGDARRGGAALARAAKGFSEVAVTFADQLDDAELRDLVVGAVLASFEFHWRKDGPTSEPVRRFLLDTTDARADVVARAEAVARAGWSARFLATTPSNVKSPQWLADQAVAAGTGSGVKVTVRDERWLADKGFGGILAVGSASATPPRLVELSYVPPKAVAREGHVVLVGKGITFDTGGLSIKPGEAMANMKRDMTGGAVVIATLHALAALGCPIRVTGLVASAENAIGGKAFRPGDVITHVGGRTTEVTNTDAEGRLVLADAMAWAVRELKPDAMVDVATLTGAMKVALGLRTGGFFANDEALADLLAAASAACGESLWRMPLASVYEDKLSSKVADSDNGAGSPGAITAALFLQHFAGDVPWAHLDVASVGDALEDWDEWTAGPTGFGVRTLLSWLEQTDPLEGIR
ncbi:leucyl aminopeptidase family protein [Nocardioides alcanivorans]|uniref:leucyl aminopeptidase family protein n=1 Tax=Nocardioides alcanivorans TaxID=2897352 RepID=UPI001F2A87F8|nr:leucyl aminopeptidase family protein [Nocardioides alcanivorans]